MGKPCTIDIDHKTELLWQKMILCVWWDQESWYIMSC
jgi:hypothetical protein